MQFPAVFGKILNQKNYKISPITFFTAKKLLSFLFIINTKHKHTFLWQWMVPYHIFHYGCTTELDRLVWNLKISLQIFRNLFHLQTSGKAYDNNITFDTQEWQNKWFKNSKTILVFSSELCSICTWTVGTITGYFFFCGASEIQYAVRFGLF